MIWEGTSNHLKWDYYLKDQISNLKIILGPSKNTLAQVHQSNSQAGGGQSRHSCTCLITILFCLDSKLEIDPTQVVPLVKIHTWCTLAGSFSSGAEAVYHAGKSRILIDWIWERSYIYFFAWSFHNVEIPQFGNPHTSNNVPCCCSKLIL